MSHHVNTLNMQWSFDIENNEIKYMLQKLYNPCFIVSFQVSLFLDFFTLDEGM